MRIKQSIYFIFVLFATSGCGYSKTDVTNESIFQRYIGNSFKLQREFTLRENEKHKYAFVKYSLVEPSADKFFGKIQEKLPSGSMLETHSIKMVRTGDYKSFYAIGKLTNNGNLNGTPFEISIGGCYVNSEVLVLRRMPWESESIPEQMQFPWKGC